MPPPDFAKPEKVEEQHLNRPSWATSRDTALNLARPLRPSPFQAPSRSNSRQWRLARCGPASNWPYGHGHSKTLPNLWPSLPNDSTQRQPPTLEPPTYALRSPEETRTEQTPSRPPPKNTNKQSNTANLITMGSRSPKKSWTCSTTRHHEDTASSPRRRRTSPRSHASPTTCWGCRSCCGRARRCRRWRPATPRASRG